jgi:hypothetical protein
MASSVPFLASKISFNPFLTPPLRFDYLIAFITLLIAKSSQIQLLTFISQQV